MRKRTIKCLCDEVFWTIIYMIPLISMALVMYRTGEFVGVSDAMSSVGFNILENNFLFDKLVEVFGTGGLVPILATDMIAYLAYFICAYLIHVLVDVLLWIPRWCHNLMKEGFKND